MMVDSMALLIGLCLNLMLLLTLVFLASSLWTWLERTSRPVSGVVHGVLFGSITLIGMLLPIQVTPGVVITGQVLLPAMAGLFGGPIAALLAAGLAILYRFAQGGSGALAGSGAIASGALLGALVAWRWGRRVCSFGARAFLLFGAVLAAGSLLWVLALPGPLVLPTLRLLLLPVGTLYPLGSLVFGTFFAQELSRHSVTAALRRSEYLYRTLARNIPNAAVFLFDHDLRYLVAEGRGLTTIFHMPADVSGKTIWEVLAPDICAVVEPWYRAALAGATTQTEYTYRDRHILIQVIPVINDQGTVTAGLALGMDITQHKAAEAQLGQQAQLLDLASDGIFVHFLPSGTISFWNQGAAAMYGWSREEALGKHPYTLLQTQFPVPLAELEATLAQTGEWQGELRQTTRHGRELVVLGRWVVQRDARGQPLAVLEINRDITARKQLEAQLFQMQKIESIGQLAGGIAHDFNNLLTAITGYTEMALDELSPDSPAREELYEIERVAGRATALTRQLLIFARRQMIEPQVVWLNELVLEVEKLLRRLLDADITLAVRLAPDLWHARVDPGQLTQVLVNLVVNARDAMPQGGQLAIETANVTLDPRSAHGHLDVPAGAYVQIAVSDTGTGMPPEVQTHLFEPFFTTKEPGKGTGLGLSTCYGIVKQHGGTIWVYSEVGKGTVMKVYLPRSGEAEPAPAPHAAGGALPCGGETVLVAEDEVTVRGLVVRTLRGGGYTVLEASNGAEALRLAHAHAPGVIHLLLTDVVMPELGGIALAEQLRAIYPDLKMLFMSGYTGHTTIPNEHLREGSSFLQKPFTTAALVQTVRHVLDGGSRC
jgi:PAS domain S-box-containing protein